MHKCWFSKLLSRREGEASYGGERKARQLERLQQEVAAASHAPPPPPEPTGEARRLRLMSVELQVEFKAQ